MLEQIKDDCAAQNLQYYLYARSYGHADYISKAIQCEEYVRGNQWDAETKQKLARRRKPALTINKTLPAVSTLLAGQISRSADVAFRPASGASPLTAHTLDKLWINFTQSQRYAAKEFLVFLNAITTSRGYFDLRLSFNESMQGEPTISILNPKDVILNPEDNYDDLTTDSWSSVMLSKWMTPVEIANTYDVDEDEVMYSAFNGIIDSDFVNIPVRNQFGYYSSIPGAYSLERSQVNKVTRYRVLERQQFEYVKKECFVDPFTGEVRMIPSAWTREQITTAIAQYGYNIIKQRVRVPHWYVSCGSLKLFNEESVYKHLTVIPCFPYIIGGKPIGVVEQLIDPQNLLNKSISQELHIVAGIANSGYKVRVGALNNMTTEQLQERGGEDGLVIEVTGELGAVEKIQPNQVPTGIDRLSYKAAEAMQEISLVNDSLQGLNRADESGKAIAQKAQNGFGALAPIYYSLDQTRELVARHWLDMTQEFVTDERIYYISGASRSSDVKEVVVNQAQEDGTFLNDLTLGEYQVAVSTVESRDSFDLEQFDILMQMIRNGAPIPWSTIIANMSILKDRDDLVEFLKQQEGRSDPSEAQKQQQELNTRMLAAQAADKEASAQVKQAQAQKVAATTQKEMQPDQSKQYDLMFKQQEAQMRAHSEEQKAQLTSQSAQAKLRFEEYKAEIENRIANDRLEFERVKMQEELAFMREKHAIELERMRAQMQMMRQKQNADD